MIATVIDAKVGSIEGFFTRIAEKPLAVFAIRPSLEFAIFPEFSALLQLGQSIAPPEKIVLSFGQSYQQSQ